MKMRLLKILGLVSICIYFTSCQKDTFQVEKQNLTNEQKAFAQRIKKVERIVEEVMMNKAAKKEIIAAITTGFYVDEQIGLRDLLYPYKSKLYNSEKFKSKNVESGHFASKFFELYNKQNNPNNYANRNSNEEFAEDSMTIYFPYSESFEGLDEYDDITLVAAEEDADEGIGREPIKGSDSLYYYQDVIVNDAYSERKATFIIGFNGELEIYYPGIEPYDPYNPPPTEADPPPPPPPAPGVSRIYIGEGICKKQYDKLISLSGNGGGSEIKYCHISGYLQPVGGNITTFQDIVSVDFGRNDITKENWKRVYIVWDDDWEHGDIEQVLCIYEEDNETDITFNGNVNTTITIPSTPQTPGGSTGGSIGYTITRQSKDEIIRQLKFSRNSYFAGAFQDQGFGFSNDATFLPPPFTHGWPKYDGNRTQGANVAWTMPYNTY